MNKINFTLDNLTYNFTVNESEDIQFVLPRKIPNYIVKSKQNVIYPTEQTTIKVFVKTQADPVPSVSIVSEDEDVKVDITGSLELLPDTLAAITFTTTDGGNSWLVNSSNSASSTAEGAEEIAKNAQNIAVESKTVANTAQTTAESAKTTAESAQTTAESAQTTAESAKTVADTAQTTAESAKTTAENVQNAVDSVETNIDTINTTLDTVKTTAESAEELAQTVDNSALKKDATATQIINSDLAIAYGKKAFLTKSDNTTQIVSIVLNNYKTPSASGEGEDSLDQVEVGSTTTTLCLNHCGATFGEDVVDKHVRVDCRDTEDGSIYKEQIAYLSDLEALEARISALEGK